MDTYLLVLLIVLLAVAPLSLTSFSLAHAQAISTLAPPALIPPPLMLAQVLPGPIDPQGFLVSEKLDGIRAYWDGRHLKTRSGRIIQAPEWFLVDFPSETLDGELWAGRGRFDFVSGVVRSETPDDSEWQQLSYQVFDLPGSPLAFEQRNQVLASMMRPMKSSWIHQVEQHSLSSASELKQLLDSINAAGGEGLMLHRRTALYQSERSSHLLKYKKHRDAEARVTGYTQGKGKYEGMVGALKVRGDDGREFRIGSGLTDELRQNPPEIGSLITYRYDGFTKTGLPRFARFLRVRFDE